MIPQIILVSIWFIGLLIVTRMHGVKILYKYNFFTFTLSKAIIVGLLYWGGFFDVWFK
jgi:hypothetical protein